MHELKTGITEAVLGLANTLGAPGLFLVALLDSSFLSFPESTDFLVVMGNPKTAWLSVAAATLGSVAGCLALYWIGLRGGEALLVSRFGEKRARRARATFERFEVLALAVPAVLPPPAPFKIFVIAAGVFELPLRKFVVTILLARGLRYTLWAVIGAVYHDQAERVLRSFIEWSARNLPALFGAFVIVLAVGGGYLWHRLRSTPDLTADAP